MITVHATGPRPPDDVWHDLVTPRSWPGWAPHITRVAGLPSPITSGARGTVHGPAGLRIPVFITEVDDTGRSWQWRVGPGRASILMDHRLDASPEGGSRVVVTIHAPFPLHLYRPLARTALRRLVGDRSTG